MLNTELTDHTADEPTAAAEELTEINEVTPQSAEPEESGSETEISPETEQAEEPSTEAEVAETLETGDAPASDPVIETTLPDGETEATAESAPSEAVEVAVAETAEIERTIAEPSEHSGETDPTAQQPESNTDEEHAADSHHGDGGEHRLVAEVAAAPHKVYLLNRVRKAITAAGEGERAEQLKAVETEIMAEVSTRTTAKEQLCEKAEELKDSTAWKVTGDAYKVLFDAWKQVGAAGRELDDQLWARFNAARGTFNERRSKHFEEREQFWAANREQKEALCVEAEGLSGSSDWKSTADAIRDLQARWKAVGSAGREKDEALWARFNTAKQTFFDHRTEAWDENRKRKEALVADAETLKDSTDWRTAGEALKVMQAEWKNVGPAGREHEDELWSRFRAATQSFFDRRSSTFAERNQAERDNLTKKMDLITRAEALSYTGDALSSAREAKELQAMWKEIGPVTREQSEALWARFREACDKIFANASGVREQQQNEWHTRMREAMTRKREQLNSLRESITHDEANIERWRETLSTLKPGGKADEIGKGLEDKIIDVMNRIRDKQERAEDLRSSINDIEAKLKE